MIGDISYNGPKDGRGEYGNTRWSSLHTDFLTPGICSLINPTVMEKMMSLPAIIYTVML